MSRFFAAAFVVVLLWSWCGRARTRKPSHKAMQDDGVEGTPAALPDDPAVVNLRHSYYKMCINRRVSAWRIVRNVIAPSRKSRYRPSQWREPRRGRTGNSWRRPG